MNTRMASTNHRGAFGITPYNKCPSRPQCPCFAFYAMMCGVQEGRHGTPGQHTLPPSSSSGAIFWRDSVVIVGRTSVLKEQRSSERFQGMHVPAPRSRCQGSVSMSPRQPRLRE